MVIDVCIQGVRLGRKLEVCGEGGNREEWGEEEKDVNKLGWTHCHLTEGVSFPKMEEIDGPPSPSLHAWLCRIGSLLEDNWEVCVARLVLIVFESSMAMGSGWEERESDFMGQ